MIFKELFLLFLFCLWPFVNFVAHNVGQGVPLGRVTAYAVGFLFLTLLWVGMVKFALRQYPLKRLICFTALAIVIFVNFSNISWVFAEVGLPHYRYAFFSSGILLLLAWRLSKIPNIRKAIVTAGIVMVGIPLIQIGFFSLNGGSATLYASVLSSKPKGNFTTSTQRKPNIYFIILDMYTRGDVLQEVFGYDNSTFLEALRQRDFYIADKSYSNYPFTGASVSSTLQMDYLLKESDQELNIDISIIRGKNKTVQTLKNFGYNYVHFDNGLWLGAACSGYEDVCLLNAKGAGIPELEYSLLQPTLFLPLYKKFVVSKKEGSSGLPELTQSLAIKKHREPVFLYAHIIAPHPPYIYHQDCSQTHTLDWDLASRKQEDKEAYRDNLVCVSKQVLSLIDQIIAGDPEAMILVQGDHGTFFQGQALIPPPLWGEPQLHEGYGILNAFHLPQNCGKHLYPSISPVNSFRLVKACLTDNEPELLPDKRIKTAHMGRLGSGNWYFLKKEDEN
ncbi:MAG: hypothetical protein A2W61_01525 [Deltaproteobacteria bacterium RIFCSPLOWO2_01_44_7]|nr:MAG: hypothetical protein A2712_02340 [Deltaproteobacteria bacterium RIFCSPHIGHO2_01_FULL_43_49]OGQ15037.1 MAG: hypothetical protein A3D22_03140 [Deltaproteobacteria bacterium RIFCSPHIGHO2_02_FULL_44_53]OGQ27344.1 MAG: hypothetical protein A3D98_02935 [Deltaproteobacteria bacterium RIFCSPHIGHO2_12_FULL_44_21]OGQ31554.1 MAG: hypothetical protein A2979_04300 [Deltaproteobacteria bacterium RIFCSPLOWO2_01_FULL_45_74]OGQ38071.1 MAG: hypothetical protein A2W61_01525 [Deltaproteobacteria bacterium 